MRWIVMGQQAFGKSALETILDAAKDEVIAVYCAPDKDSRVDPIKEFLPHQGHHRARNRTARSLLPPI